MTLKYILVLAAFIAASVLGDDYEDDPVYKQEHCIKITPEKEEQLKALILDIGDYLTQLTMKYEDIDIRYVRFDIESHSDDEKEEKEMILKVNINDCKEQGTRKNEIPKVEEKSNGHAGMEIQVNDESDDFGNEAPAKNSNYHEQYKGTSNQGNVNNAGSEYPQDQRNLNDNKKIDNTETQRQNQMQIQQDTSVGYVGLNQGQTGDKTNQSHGCDCKKDTTTGPDSLNDDNFDNILGMAIKDYNLISAVSMQRPTVTFLQLPENGQEMINFLESRKKKKIEPVWVYMLEEGDKKEFVVFQ